MCVLVLIFGTFFNVILILLFSNQAYSQGGFIINQVFHDADEWVVKETYLAHELSGELLNTPGGLTEYGTELGKYVHNRDIDGSNGICVKLNKNGSWNKIRCPGPKTERLIDNEGRHKYISSFIFFTMHAEAAVAHTTCSILYFYRRNYNQIWCFCEFGKRMGHSKKGHYQHEEGTRWSDMSKTQTGWYLG